MIVKNKQYDLVVAGHLCLDIIPSIPDTGATRMEQIFRPGTLVNVGACRISTGGPVSNTGLGVAKLGCDVAFMAKVGDDEYGRIVERLLAASGSGAGLKKTTETCTSYTVAISPPNIDRMFLHCPGTNDTFRADDVDFALVRQAGHFHLGYPPLMKRMYADEGRELAEIFKRAKEAGATTSLDLSLPDPNSPSGAAPWGRILEAALPHVDVFLPSIEEAFFMLRRDEWLRRKQQHGGAELIDHITPAEYSEIAGQFLELGVAMTALKSGHRGYYFRTREKSAFARLGAVRPADADCWSQREIWAPAYRVPKIASATGSGDSSIAGFLAAFLRGHTLEECLQCANCTGWQNLHELDAVSGIRTWDETLALVRGGELEVLDPHLDRTGWKQDEPRRLWYGPNDCQR